MSHILITNRRGKTTRFNVGIASSLMIVLLVVALVGGSYYAGAKKHSTGSSSDTDELVSELQTELTEYQTQVSSIRLSVEENMSALAQRLGQVKAHVIRLDALGERLIEKVKLDKGEFDFDNVPALGGPGPSSKKAQKTLTTEEFLGSLDELSAKMKQSSLQLDILESMIMNKELHAEVFPSGRPIKRGWISSYFGYRNDPFTGRRAHHDGIDLAGKKGSEVIAVASGVVTWAGKRYGYGNLVEINHGNGYVTRYGHNEDIKVKVGQTVKKGETISAMGSTGRSTGPHVHFEVIRHGRTVDPMKYVKAGR